MATAKEKPIDRVIREVTGGLHDDGLADLVAAIGDRVGRASLRMPWVIDVDGIVIDEEELTLRQCAAIERATGVRWHQIDPSASAATVLAIIEVVLHDRDGLDSDAVRERTGKLTAVAVANGLRVRTVNPPEPAASS